MTGRELIELIQKNHAEDMPVLVQYRDAGGPYPDGEEAGFNLLYGKMNSGAYDYTWEITYPEINGYLPDGLEPNVILL